MKRRQFLRLGGSLCVGFSAAACLPVIPKRPIPDLSAAAGWIRYADGTYSLYLPRAEFGQNIATALKQIAVEELGITWQELELILPSTIDIDPVKATVGSDSIKEFALPLAQACATLRQALAAGRTAGELAVTEIPATQLRSFRGKGRYVGRDVPMVHGKEIVSGKPLFASDIRRPGMLFGRVLRAPASPEIVSRPRTWEIAAARRVSGYVAVVDDPALTLANSRGLGIVALTPGALDRIEAALAVGWQVDGSFEASDVDRQIDIDRRLEKGCLDHRLVDDSLETSEDWDVDLRLDIPMGAHTPLEPRVAVAEFFEDGVEIWAGSQDAFYMRDVIADAMDMPKDRVIVRNQRLGGGFGGRTICTVELEAAVLARAARRPVKLQWTRAQEFRQGFHRPPSSHRVRARLREGRLVDWWHAFASGHILFTNAALPSWMQKLTDFVSDKGVARGAVPPYRIPHRRIEHDQVRLPVLTGPWRGLGAGPNALVVECVMDLCAERAGMDPLTFRLNHLDDPRLTAVLRHVAAIAGWFDDRDGENRGLGLACGIYKNMSYAAVIAEASIAADGSIVVPRVWCVHDCGQVINAMQVRAQCEGNIVWGLSMALMDHLPVAASGVAAESFADVRLPQLSQVPDMQIHLIESAEPPSGAGETAIVAVSGAILNAVRAATGAHPSRLPMGLREAAG